MERIQSVDNQGIDFSAKIAALPRRIQNAQDAIDRYRFPLGTIMSQVAFNLIDRGYRTTSAGARPATDPTSSSTAMAMYADLRSLHRLSYMNFLDREGVITGMGKDREGTRSMVVRTDADGVPVRVLWTMSAASDTTPAAVLDWKTDGQAYFPFTAADNGRHHEESELINHALKLVLDVDNMHGLGVHFATYGHKTLGGWQYSETTPPKAKMKLMADDMDNVIPTLFRVFEGMAQSVGLLDIPDRFKIFKQSIKHSR